MESVAPVIDGAEMAVLHGDPTQAGQYVIRFRTNREISVPLHWHRHDEHITLIAGPFAIGPIESIYVDPASDLGDRIQTQR